MLLPKIYWISSSKFADLKETEPRAEKRNTGLGWPAAMITLSWTQPPGALRGSGYARNSYSSWIKSVYLCLSLSPQRSDFDPPYEKGTSKTASVGSLTLWWGSMYRTGSENLTQHSDEAAELQSTRSVGVTPALLCGTAQPCQTGSPEPQCCQSGVTLINGINNESWY